MKKAFLALSAIVILTACNHRKEQFSKLLLCTQILSDTVRTNMQHPQLAADNRRLWPHPMDMPLNIIVKFLNGTSFQRNKVMQYAAVWDSVSTFGWNKTHKIRFLFVSDNYPPLAYTNVRIQFNDGGGSNSAVGSDCDLIPENQPTTVFGWVDPEHSEEEIKQVVLHELGHTLGLIHELQSPTARIPWDKDKVYQYYHDTQTPPWTKEQVDQNIIQLYDPSVTIYTAFDSLSIMCYAVPASLTTNGYSIPWHSNLSTMDSAFIKKIYPYTPCIPGETCCWDRKGHRIPCP